MLFAVLLLHSVDAVRRLADDLLKDLRGLGIDALVARDLKLWTSAGARCGSLRGQRGTEREGESLST